MSFLFKSKKQQASALPAATRDTTTSPQAQPPAPSSAIPTANAPRTAHHSQGSGSVATHHSQGSTSAAAAHTPTPVSSVNNSVGSLPPAAATASPKQEVHRDRANSESQASCL
ncbi:uncharacterized protein K452DRAFT_109559 [Aplosporella prunicola CBS 121167]|uniref:Uncharacterized protein n=1 Tax=Aplosporella prunicola CBS 121167 TaxID=1176127 RepID=A0A6A6BQS9_9PEZI|nr:uncharacterized protein K452DRAFT_109559 [Aplosporella prunicola CBS 121167]KAF2146360.1 hypothetical protein K452DRAFT_109559 [Aplosporella prunicola CBS 121167]